MSIQIPEGMEHPLDVVRVGAWNSLERSTTSAQKNLEPVNNISFNIFLTHGEYSSAKYCKYFDWRKCIWICRLQNDGLGHISVIIFCISSEIRLNATRYPWWKLKTSLQRCTDGSVFSCPQTASHYVNKVLPNLWPNWDPYPSRKCTGDAVILR